MPRRFSPGASINDDYAHICDNCQIDDGRATLGWTIDDDRYFDLCFECLDKLFLQYIPTKPTGEHITVRRAIISEELRNEIFSRDGYQCVLCKATDNLGIDHIVPFSRGGETKKSNLRTLCKKCNSKKGSRCLKVTNTNLKLTQRMAPPL